MKLEASPETGKSSTHRLRGAFRLDSLLELRLAADKHDKAASESASIELAALKQEREQLLARSAEIQARLGELASSAQEARSEHARAVKARQAAINELKTENDKQVAQIRGGGLGSLTPSRRPGGGGGAGRRGQTPATRFRGFRPPAAKRAKLEDSPAVGSGNESDESRATSSSKPASSNAE